MTHSPAHILVYLSHDELQTIWSALDLYAENAIHREEVERLAARINAHRIELEASPLWNGQV